MESDDKLVDILDLDYPLIREFREAAPSSFKHCQAVSNTMEVIALELSLNVKLMKAAGLFHDIGKMLYPEYFSENQDRDNNPHDELDPLISYLIITRHVSDSVNILINDENVPRELIEVVSQHHGTSVAKSFLNKELKSKKKNGFDFRYRTSKPQSPEAMILMICDIIEATARSAQQNRKNVDPGELVERVVSECLLDRQFDNVSIKLGIFSDIKQIIVKDIAGSFQKRVDYEEEIVDNGEEEADD